MNMRKNQMHRLCLCLMLCIALLLTSCGKDAQEAAPAATPAPHVDYASELKLNMQSETAKVDATVHTFVDGDTTHFHVSTDIIESGEIKARYLAVNTPESTGKIEQYGKAASAFTRAKLESADSIILESDTAQWNLDSTAGRHLVWVWYRPAGESEYRNLNIEILQNGLAIANSTANNRYGSTAMAALNQARAEKLNLYSGLQDPDFYYGSAIELTIRELRLNPEAYNGMKVAFSGVITMNNANSVYVEDYDEESGLYFGMSVYYGYGLPGAGLDVLKVGNESRIVGTLQYYEAGGTWQVSGLSYQMMKPDDPDNLKTLSSGNAASWKPTSASDFATGEATFTLEDGSVTLPYAFTALGTTVEMTDLTVNSAYTTTDEASSSYGAITLFCTAEDGTAVTVRTIPFKGADGSLVTQEAFLGKTIDVKGIVDYFDGQYQIKVFTMNSVTFAN